MYVFPKNPLRKQGKICSIFFYISWRNNFFKVLKLYKHVFFLCVGKLPLFISTLLFDYTKMKMTNLSWPPTNMNSIGEVCDSLGKDSLTLFVGNHCTGLLYWLTVVNSDSGEGRDYKPVCKVYRQSLEAWSLTVFQSRLHLNNLKVCGKLQGCRV